MTRDGKDDEMPRLLKAARAYAGVSQEELAERIGVSLATVSAWERGKTRVPKVARAGVVEGLIDLGGPAHLFDGREIN